MRRFDHAVLCVPDLNQARAAYAGLGFTLTPPARHPFGTYNSLVQFADRSFLELLAIAEPEAIRPAPPGHFSFATFCRDFIARHGAGMTMLVFATDDADADVAAFRSAGLQTYDRFDFGRDAVLPDGSTTRLGFSLAFVTHPAMPEVAFFTCQHRHPPGLFWKPQYQTHANGAQGVTGATMTAADPPAFAPFLQALTGSRAEHDADATVRVGPASCRITVRRGADAETPRFKGLTLAAARPRNIAAADACGTALEFAAG